MKITRNVLCDGCKGNGSSDGKNYTCDSCDGQGTKVVMRQMGPGMYTQSQVHCPKCRGEGEVIPENRKCTKCHSNKLIEEKKILTVEVDRGTKDGKRIIFRGESNEMPGCQTGDVVFVVKEREHKAFKRDGVHLYMDKNIPLVNALTGYQFVVTHLDGRKLLVSTDNSVIKPGDARELTNEGMPVLTRPYEKGNLYVKFNVVFPDKISPKQSKSLITSLPGAEVVEKTPDLEEALLRPVNPDNVRQDSYAPHGNAYDEDDEEDGRPQQVQCHQQ